jgi:hypothetical protein
MSRWPKKETELVQDEPVETIESPAILVTPEPEEIKESEEIKEPIYEVKVLEVISFRLGAKCHRMEPVGRFVPVSKEVYEFLEINPYNYLIVLSSDTMPDIEVAPNIEVEKIVEEISKQAEITTPTEPDISILSSTDISNLLKASIFNMPELEDEEEFKDTVYE